MKKLLLIILFLSLISHAYSYDYRGAENCEKIAFDEKVNKKWYVTDNHYEFLQVINRTNRKDLSFKEIDFEKPYFYTSGINIKTKDTSYSLCFDFNTN